MPTTNDDIDPGHGGECFGWYSDTPYQNTQAMVATSSLYRVEELCPICREFVTTYTQKDNAPIPLNIDVAAAVPWDLTRLRGM
jgi:hypothetical protein